MRKTMKQIAEDREREDRIINEIIVDAYGEEEHAMGWYYYLQDTISWPFKAECVIKINSSPLEPGEKVSVKKLASEDDCMRDVYVMISWNSRNLAVPLSQLSPYDTDDDDTIQAVEDWCYWCQRGYQF